MKNYSYLNNILKNSRHRHEDGAKIDNNTRIRYIDGDKIAVKLHKTDIIVVDKNDCAVINTCGWQTVTTKQRLTDFVCIHQKNHQWKIKSGDEYIGFFDGIVVDLNTQVVLNAPKKDNEDSDKALVKKLDRLIKEYCKETAARWENLSDPGAGDCFYCSGFFGGAENDYGHVIDHLQEKYLMKRFVFKCAHELGYRHGQAIWIIGADKILKKWFSKNKIGMVKYVKDMNINL